MGYTHYYRQPKTVLDQERWEKMVLDFYQVLPEFYNILDHETDQKLEANMDIILFNGIGEEAHETFVLERKPDLSYTTKEDKMVFNFCKTARKEYDIAVCITLIIAKHYFPELVINSDGSLSDEWLESLDFVKTNLHYGSDFGFD